MNTVIIVAGGIGTRMKSAVPKQFLLLCKKPILMRTIEIFAKFDKTIEIIVTLPENQINTWENLCLQYNFKIAHTIVIGGITRFHSVKNALAKTNAKSDFIAVHDGVRPLVSINTIKRCFDCAKTHNAVIPILQVSESLRRIDDSGNSQIIDRNGICIIQTPQVFSRATLVNAYNNAFSINFTDDASVVEQSGGKLFFVEGNRENIKITRPEDIVYAEKMLEVVE